jgi:hypothetical protein
MKFKTKPSLLDFPVDTEVVVLKLGPQISPYNGKQGRIVDHRDGMLHVILDDDPIPRWRNIGIFCEPGEVRCIDNLD